MRKVKIKLVVEKGWKGRLRRSRREVRETSVKWIVDE
jgi:hypothetical protein